MGTMLIIKDAHSSVAITSLLGDKLATLMAAPDYVSKMSVGAAPGNAYLILTGCPRNIRIQRVGFPWGVDHQAGTIGFSIVKRGQRTPATPQYVINSGADIAKGTMVYTNVTPVEFDTAEDAIVIYNSLAADWRAGMYASASQPSVEWRGMQHCSARNGCADSFDQGNLNTYGSRFVMDICGIAL